MKKRRKRREDEGEGEETGKLEKMGVESYGGIEEEIKRRRQDRVEAVCSRLFPRRHSHMFTSHTWLRTLPVPARLWLSSLSSPGSFSHLMRLQCFLSFRSGLRLHLRTAEDLVRRLSSRPSVQKKRFHSSELQIHQQTRRLIVTIRTLLHTHSHTAGSAFSCYLHVP